MEHDINQPNGNVFFCNMRCEELTHFVEKLSLKTLERALQVGVKEENFYLFDTHSRDEEKNKKIAHTRNRNNSSQQTWHGEKVETSEKRRETK